MVYMATKTLIDYVRLMAQSAAQWDMFPLSRNARIPSSATVDLDGEQHPSRGVTASEATQQPRPEQPNVERPNGQCHWDVVAE
jgi:hypothetical protein